jgi:hypothetical protein
MTGQDLLLMLLLAAPAIGAHLRQDPDHPDFSTWMKAELAERLRCAGLQVQTDLPYGDYLTLDLQAASPLADPPQLDAIDLVTETEVGGTMDALQAAAERLGQYTAEGCTARWAVGVGFSAECGKEFGLFAADPDNGALCGEDVSTGIVALVVTVPAAQP